MKRLSTVSPALLLVAASAVQALPAADHLTIVNPAFSNVPVQCSGGYAYQASAGETCAGPNGPAQSFNGAPGMKWLFTPHTPQPVVPGTGLTGPNTGFNPPPFTSLPFTQAALLQGANSAIAQTIPGFVAGKQYVLSFYLGSRYDTGASDKIRPLRLPSTIGSLRVGSW